MSDKQQAASKSSNLAEYAVVACLFAALASMDSYAHVQRVLMGSAGVRVRQRESLAVIWAFSPVPAGRVPELLAAGAAIH